MRTGLLGILVFFLATVGYVAWHLGRLTPGGWAAKWGVALLFLLWMAAAFASMGLRSKASISTITALYEIGHPWMIAYLYLLIAFLLADLGVLLRLIPKGWLTGNGYTMAGLLGVIAVLLWIDLILAEQPDLVLFGGDIVDISLRPLLEGDYASEFARIQAPIYTVLGNHEYIGNEADAERFFADAGITLLRDSTAFVEGIAVIGRDDRSNPGRKPLSALSVPPECFTILLDHQPYHLEEAQAAGIDFQFSGHTHRGQVWPLSWVTDALYEKSWGHHRRGSTQYYVSSGLGIWGPKTRIGTRSEYLVLHIQ